MKIRVYMYLVICIVLCFCSCKFKREETVIYPSNSNGTMENMEETIMVPVLLLDYNEEQFKKYNYGEALAQLIYGMTEEEAIIYQFDELNPGNRETKTWYYFERAGIRFEFGTNEYNKADSYYSIISTGALTEWEFRRFCPEDEIDTCTKEEAIAVCAPYANALGLDNDNITIETYAVTMDFFQQEYWVNRGAPDETFEYYTRAERLEKQAQGLEEEATQMWYSNMQSNNLEENPWEKKHEAILIIYRMHVDRVEINSTYQQAYMIYVPYYEEVVYGAGYLPFGKKEVINEITIISKSEALEVAYLTVGKEVTVEDVVLTYILRDEDEFDQLTELKAIPAWRVDYTIGNRKSSIWIDAMDGHVRYASGIGDR